MIDYHENTMFLLGGMVEKKPGCKCKTEGTVVDTIYKFSEGVWSLLPTKLPKPRYGFQVVLGGDSIFIFTGDAGDGNPATTQIEIFNVKTLKIQIAEYRLPLGVSGCSMAWHGDDILLIGGNRCGSTSGSKEVMKLDFVEKNIISLRDLHQDRVNAIVIPMEHDRILVVAGSKDGAKAEERYWEPELMDYVWRDFSKINGDLGEIFEKPSEYSHVMSTFCVTGSDSDRFPKLNTTSNFVFGNELSPWMMEFTNKMKVNFYPAPMRLQQKTGQVAYRHSHNIMYFLGGTDVTYTFYSKKVFKFDFTEKAVTQIGNLNIARAGFCTVKLKVSEIDLD